MPRNNEERRPRQEGGAQRGNGNQFTTNSNALDSAVFTAQYTSGQVTCATSRLFVNHLAELVETYEAQGRAVRALVPLLARARMLQRDLAVVIEQEGGAA
jgi:hypothetical protein